MDAVTVGADGSFGGSVGDRAPVDAFLVGMKLLRALADALHHYFLAVTGAASGGNVVVMDG